MVIWKVSWTGDVFGMALGIEAWTGFDCDWVLALLEAAVWGSALWIP